MLVGLVDFMRVNRLSLQSFFQFRLTAEEECVEKFEQSLKGAWETTELKV